MRRAAIISAGLLATGAPPAPAAEEFGDRVRGELLFTRQCSACHMVGEDAFNRIGPHLNGLFGRAAGSLAGVSYSAPMRQMGENGLRWTPDTLDGYIAAPQATVPGTRMNYRGMADPEARGALIAWLRDFSDMPQNIPESPPTARRVPEGIDPAVLEIAGDAEYGEYLASECTTCHQRDGSDQGLPSITGWPAEDFAIAMHAYKADLRDHAVMQMMAKRLDDEEIAALAAWFATLD